MATTEHLDRLLADRQTRLAQRVFPAFFQLSGPPTELCPRGTVAVVAGLPGSGLFDKVRAALETNNIEALNSSIREARESEAPPAGRAIPSDKALQIALDADTYADVRHLGRTVVSNVFLTTDVDFARVFLPYAGGSLDAGDFDAALFQKNESARGLQLLIVAHPPRLSETEESLIRRLPAASREMQVGDADVVLGTPAALFATVTAAVVGAAVGYAIGRALQHLMLESFNRLEERELAAQPENVKKLNKTLATAAVGQMIATKRQLLKELK